MEQPTTNQAVSPNGNPPAAAVPPREHWKVDEREVRLLPMSLLLAYLTASFLFNWLGSDTWKHPGFGITVLTAGWYAVLFLYRGTLGMRQKTNRILMAAVILLSLTFTLFSNQWLRFWNRALLLVLVAVHTGELCGGCRLPWSRAGMLAERLGRFAAGPFVRCGALLETIASLKNRQGLRRWLPVLVGTGVTLPALWLVTSVLMDADAVFALVAGDTLAWLERHFGQVLMQLFLALCMMPFLFSLLYFAAHTETKTAEEKTRKAHDSLSAAILLDALNLLYLFFLAVQSTALFGNRAYLERAGISFAEYARSGFFQLAGLAGLNIAVILAVNWLCREDRYLRLAASILVGLTAVLLVSAAWRMTLYVSVYGLSFKRLLTYWGMGLMAVLLVLTVRKIWRRDFQFFRTAAPVVLAWWLLLNYCNIDAVTAKYNTAQAEAGRLADSAVEDLLFNRFGYDGLFILEDHLTDSQVLSWTKEEAARDCQNWTTWSVSAWHAAQK
ncbi:MAG: DUF4173 domain-containing protein [Oscillospiraceae bacterium]|nr:DUF4173 domain-containing protein [Oscillospiraceae bacterium]